MHSRHCKLTVMFGTREQRRVSCRESEAMRRTPSQVLSSCHLNRPGASARGTARTSNSRQCWEFQMFILLTYTLIDLTFPWGERLAQHSQRVFLGTRVPREMPLEGSQTLVTLCAHLEWALSRISENLEESWSFILGPWVSVLSSWDWRKVIKAGVFQM